MAFTTVSTKERKAKVLKPKSELEPSRQAALSSPESAGKKTMRPPPAAVLAAAEKVMMVN